MEKLPPLREIFAVDAHARSGQNGRMVTLGGWGREQDDLLRRTQELRREVHVARLEALRLLTEVRATREHWRRVWQAHHGRLDELIAEAVAPLDQRACRAARRRVARAT